MSPELHDIVIGQEAVCPDGLGRVAEVIPGVAGSFSIKVNTYIENRACNWDSKNVSLVPIKGIQTDA